MGNNGDIRGHMDASRQATVGSRPTKTKNWRLQEEFSEKSCILTIEAELKQSENVAVNLRDRIAEYKGQV